MRTLLKKVNQSHENNESAVRCHGIPSVNASVGTSLGGSDLNLGLLRLDKI